MGNMCYLHKILLKHTSKQKSQAQTIHLDLAPFLRGWLMGITHV